ncbi:MAG: SDR family NAD(P)-dependent oxidoreductase [Fimbriimonadales bacterium]|nr:SDR family NAD(P)-dependent oxidoreductase [Fimbriimonadales bacterium]
MPDLGELIRLSRRYGSDKDFVIAGGGNTSFKVEGRMWVKASGVALAEIDESGFVEMDLAALRAIVESDLGGDPEERELRFKEAIYAARLRPELGQRPSVECAVHALFPHAYVVHTHATYANMLSCCVQGERLCRELLGPEVVWVPYTDPGFLLAKSIAERLQGADASRPVAMLWQNHGFVVAAERPDEIAEVTERVLARVRALVPSTPAGGEPPSDELLERLLPSLRGAMLARGWASVLRCRTAGPGRAFADHPEAQRLASLGPLIPDQIVYCKSFPLWLGMDEDPGPALDAHLAETGYPPKIVLVPGVGLLAAAPSAKEADAAADMYEDAVRVALGAEALGGVAPLSQRDREFIDAWEVEQYRRQVAAAGTPGRFAGKVAVVTGAAQGFGKGLAERLAADGAHVALWDVAEEQAQAVAEELNRCCGPGRALALRADVSDPASVREAMLGTLVAFGGIDLFVANAGILRAGSVKEQPHEEFERVTRVNYIGFFLCAQAAARAMASQNARNPGAWTDIVQINSKSGLQGSNRNGAYAGGKFGAIGLVQSFAMELLADRIKVNAVCPGNFFDGPLWSDPQNGLFVQYLRAGKVPGAQTTEDVRRFYEAKVPMGRGCGVDDVYRALVYVVEQQYETGQAVPVTGGQVMLH